MSKPRAYLTRLTVKKAKEDLRLSKEALTSQWNTLETATENLHKIDSVHGMRKALASARSERNQFASTWFNVERAYNAIADDQLKEEFSDMRMNYDHQCTHADDLIKRAVCKLNDVDLELSSNCSTNTRRTISTVGSRRSNTTSQIAELLADAEAADTRAKYEKEIAIKQAELRSLEAQSEAAALRAKAKALSAAYEDEGSYLFTKTTPDQTSNDHASIHRNKTTTPKSAPDQTSDDHASIHRNKTTTPKSATTPDAVWNKTIDVIARRSLPICKPQIYNGDPMMYLTWRRSFKAMIDKANVSATDELSYLAEFTMGPAKKLVEHFCQRHTNDPQKALEEAWQKLGERFGHPSVITNGLKEALFKGSKFKGNENEKLREFSDLCNDISAQMEELPGLHILNSEEFMNPVICQLPKYIQSKWESKASRYIQSNNFRFPPFSFFANLIETISEMKNNPMLKGINTTEQEKISTARVMKTTTNVSTIRPSETSYCPFHEINGHHLSECRSFKAVPINERNDLIRHWNLCFRCCSNSHKSKDCTTDVRCEKCGSSRHISLLCKENQHDKAATDHGEEKVTSTCTTICRNYSGGRSCAKIILAEIYQKNHPSDAVSVYVVLDDQSNASLLKSELADRFGPKVLPSNYCLTTCSKKNELRKGRRITNLMIRAIDGTVTELPTLIECNNIPDDPTEIPTPEIAAHYNHLKDIADKIPRFRKGTPIQILLGRDAGDLLKVRESRNGPPGAPWAQRLDLGWTISGQVCLDSVGRRIHISVSRTNIGDIPKNSNKPNQPVLSPCTNTITVKEDLVNGEFEHGWPNDIYVCQNNDNTPSLSSNDRKFIKIMERGIHKNESGNWEMPLPFKENSIYMPDNRAQVLGRLRNLKRKLNLNPVMKQHYFEFMGRLLERRHATPVPENELQVSSGKKWYLPHFGVYHPKKPDQIRVVFDSSAECDGVSLNQRLLNGPDQMNSLVGILMRFRQEKIAIMADIEQMFHSFHVSPMHRDYLRFFWYKNNDPTKNIIEYRMGVHLFGNGPSPAVATFGLRKTADDTKEIFGEKSRNFIHKDFYVDDGLKSVPTTQEAIHLLKSTQAMLATAKLHLHKVVSNDINVMQSLPAEHRAKSLQNIDLNHDPLPTQRSLGVYWNLEKDSFTFKVTTSDKPFTRRGVLSVVNSLYDPLGLAAPVVIEGKSILQTLTRLSEQEKREGRTIGWDEPLPESIRSRWEHWKGDLSKLERVNIDRCYRSPKCDIPVRTELHSFCDASTKAIAQVAYLRQIDYRGLPHVSFVFGKAKVAPIATTSIPRLELCAALLAAEAVQRIISELDIQIDEVYYYSDSKVVLGYIQNESRRFYVYVANRVQLIHNLSEPRQWHHIATKHNPADIASRGISAEEITNSFWFNGPDFLHSSSLELIPSDDFAIDSSDPDVRSCNNAILSTKVATSHGIGTSRFQRFSNWQNLKGALARLIVVCRKFKNSRADDNDKTSQRENRKITNPSVRDMLLAEILIIKNTQMEEFEEEIQILTKTGNSPAIDRQLPKGNKLCKLNPFIDDDGLLRVGGRLQNSHFDAKEKHPVLLPKNHHISKLVVYHFHEQTHHQGRQMTHGAIRSSGFWIVGGRQMVASMIGRCVLCRRLRRPTETQIMADLPQDRVEPGPPFTNVGLDVFGPWLIQVKKTRGSSVNAKRWGVIFTCLVLRSIHIEIIESMDTSAFICALRRFIAIRGPLTLLRCDRGTNFIGAKSELDQALAEIDQEIVTKYLLKAGCEWQFNPPHSSHFGGAWERQIRTVRQVLDAMMLELGPHQLTHELLVTLMAEASSIVNSRPIIALSSDPNDPQPITPNMLLTMKARPLVMAPGIFTEQDTYSRRRWRRVQFLADQFWVRWRKQYLQDLQSRQIWSHREIDVDVGDVVLLREKESHRNLWPLGVVENVVQSADGHVRKANITVIKDGVKKTYLRPIREIVVILRKAENS